MSRRKKWGFLAFLVLITGVIGVPPVAAVPGNDTTVLILDSTVSGGAASREATAATGLGLTVEVVSDATWAGMTAADFGSYRAIILGDATCGGVTTIFEANEATWGPQVDGNVVLIGTDPIFHESQGGGALTDKGVAFAADRTGKTGLYATLSCAYDSTAPLTPVPAFNSLSSAGDFTVTGVPGCFNAAHIVAAHPALAGLTDAVLSNWGCSVHEAFDGWPSDFQVLAIALTGTAYTAGDGSVGTPYILARGEGLVPIGSALTPTTAENPVGTPHTVTMTILKAGLGVAGISVGFEIVDGPNLGLVGTDITDADGKATFTWSSAVVGTDIVEASYEDSSKTIISARATKTWFEAKKVPSTKLTKTASATSIGYGKSVTYTYTEKNDGEVDLLRPWVVDDKCAPVAGTLGLDLIHNVGDTNLDGVLSIGETWTFTCSTKLWADTTNTAVGHGYLSDGTDVTWCDPKLIDPKDPKTFPKGVFCDQDEYAQVTVDVSAGCSPGYWKQDQHFGSWVGYTPGQQFSTVFENAFPGQTLLQVLWNGKGGLNALGRQTVAALLNASNPTVSGIGFPYTPAGVIAAFNDVFPGGDYEALKNRFEAANTIGCPLGRAVVSS